MNEVKTPKKPLLYYYSIALLLLLLFNFLAMPRIAERRVQEVDYGTFMTMAENKEIGQVEVQETGKPDYLYQQRRHRHLQDRHDAG